jgi:hypothetical protein
MNRTVVLRGDPTDSELSPVIVNDEIGLDPYVDYTIQDHLEDLAMVDGVSVLTVTGNQYRMSDGSLILLEERKVPVDETKLDLATRLLVQREDYVARGARSLRTA